MRSRRCKLALVTGAAVAALGMTTFLGAAPSTATRIWDAEAAVGATLLLAAPASAATRTWDGGGSSSWSDPQSWVGDVAPVNGDSVVLNTDGSDPASYDLAGGVTLAAVTLENGSSSEDLTVSGSPIPLASGGSITNNRTLISNTSSLSAGVTLNGPATLTQAGTSLFQIAAIGGTGPLTLQNSSSGTFRLIAPSTYSGATVVNGTERVLTLTNGAIPTGSAVTVNGSLRFFTSATIGSLAGGGTVDAAGTLSVGGDGSSTTFSGVYQNAGATPARLTKEGAGTFTLSGSNTHTGATTVNAGTLRAGGTNTLSPSSAHTVGSGATLDLNGFSQMIGSLAGAGDVTLGSGQLIAGGDGSSTTFSGVISGTGALYKEGAGTLTLSGANTYSGDTPFFDGTIAVAHDNALGTGALLISGNTALRAAANGLSLANHVDILPGRALTVDTQVHALTLAGVLSGDGAVTKTGSGALTLLTSNSYAGGTTLANGTIAVGNNSSLGTGALTLAGAASLVAAANGLDVSNPVSLGASTLTIDTQANTHTHSGNITGAGGLTKIGTGTLTLSGAGNTYSGTTTLSAGTLRAGGANAFSANSTLSVSSAATLDLNNLNQTIGSLAGAGSVTLGTATLTAGGNNASTTHSGVISGAGALAKTGTGTLTLTGANTHGTTTVQSGRVNFNGNQPLSNVLLQGGIAGGTGRIGALAATGGTLAPGLSPGLLTMAEMILSSATTFEVELNGTTAGTEYDQARVTTGVVDLSDATLAGTVGFAPAAGTVFIIIDKQSAGAVTGTFNGIAQGGFVTLGGTQFAVSYTGGDGNDVTLTVTGTPLVAPAALPAITVDEPFNTTITASGGVAPYTFAVTAGALPAGLTLTAATGVIAGTPTTAGPYAFTITATDSLSVTDTQAYNGTVNPPLAIAPGTLPDMTVGEPVNVTFTASGGVGPHTFAVTAGALPAGLSLAAGTGVLSGTPTTAGPFSFSITATDSTGATEVQAYSGTVAPAPVPSLPFLGLMMLALLIGGIGYARLRAGGA